MYQVHTQIARYPFVYTAKSLTEAKTVKQTLLNVGSAFTIAYITDANGERV